jgi:hypothetical protein
VPLERPCIDIALTRLGKPHSQHPCNCKVCLKTLNLPSNGRQKPIMCTHLVWFCACRAVRLVCCVEQQQPHSIHSTQAPGAGPVQRTPAEVGVLDILLACR